MSDENEFKFDLLMPFLPVQSKDGPFEDCAYVAGWEMGMLDAELRMADHSDFAVTIRTENRGQADLVAMRYGYDASFVDYHDGWTGLTVKRLVEVT